MMTTTFIIHRVSWSKVRKMVQEVKYMPSVIEPSFGIGRVLYSLLEHSFSQRKTDENVCMYVGRLVGR